MIAINPLRPACIPSMPLPSLHPSMLPFVLTSAALLTPHSYSALIPSSFFAITLLFDIILCSAPSPRFSVIQQLLLLLTSLTNIFSLFHISFSGAIETLHKLPAAMRPIVQPSSRNCQTALDTSLHNHVSNIP